jgi:hypothetical protein
MSYLRGNITHVVNTTNNETFHEFLILEPNSINGSDYNVTNDAVSQTYSIFNILFFYLVSGWGMRFFKF